jgi:hypothetical protein
MYFETSFFADLAPIFTIKLVMAKVLNSHANSLNQVVYY